MDSSSSSSPDESVSSRSTGSSDSTSSESFSSSSSSSSSSEGYSESSSSSSSAPALLAPYFDATNENIITDATITIPTDYTISFWIKVAGVSGNAHFYISGDTKMYMQISSAPTNPIIIANPGGSVSAPVTSTWRNGNWHMMTVTVDVTNNEINLYVDTTVYSAAVTGTLTAQDVDTFQLMSSGAYHFDATIQEVSMWDRILSATDISNLYQNNLPHQGDISKSPWDSGLVYAWHLDEGTGTSINNWEGGVDSTMTAGVDWVIGKMRG